MLVQFYLSTQAFTFSLSHLGITSVQRDPTHAFIVGQF